MSVTPRAHTDCISNPILPLLSKHSQKIRFSTCIPILPLSFPSNPFLLLFFPSSHFPFLPTLSSYSTLLTTLSFLLSITPFPTTVYSPSHAFLLFSFPSSHFPFLPTLSSYSTPFLSMDWKRRRQGRRELNFIDGILRTT